MKFTTPKEYSQHESKVAPTVRLTNSFRVQMSMDRMVREYARANRSDMSVVIRHALHEYLTKRGVDAYQPLSNN